MKEFSEEIVDSLVHFGFKLLLAIVIVTIGFKIVDFVLKRFQKGKFFKHIEKSSQTFMASILSVGLKGLVLLTAITELGIPMTSIIALLGSIGLALGLALQGGLSNIAGGVMIMLFKPFKVGDYIDTHSDAGTVTSINIFHTVLNTYDNKTIVIPNGSLSNMTIVNYTKNPERLLDITVAVSYKSNINKVKKVLKKIASQSIYNIRPDETLIALKEHADSALIFTFRMWVLNTDYWNCKFEFLETIKEEFDKEGIEIPYPQLDVHVEK